MAFNVLHFSRRWLGFLSYARRIELYPPFWLMGVKVREWSDDSQRIRIHLPLNWRSRNMGGSMFGGYQASLADPIAPLACSRIFSGYDVWTRKLVVDFRAPGSTHLELRFDFPAEKREEIRLDLEAHGRSNPVFEYGFFREDGVCCSKVHCTVAIRERGFLKKAGVGTAG
jgi:acyl-coenzyme A thioesterase PaaI-like protein